MFPHLRVEDKVLFVHDGRAITSAGGAKSFEAALYLCELLYGPEIAKDIAKGLVIEWEMGEVDPDSLIQKDVKVIDVLKKSPMLDKGILVM
jgi:transcriptional regulator GlxA family with amidase domain